MARAGSTWAFHSPGRTRRGPIRWDPPRTRRSPCSTWRPEPRSKSRPTRTAPSIGPFPPDGTSFFPATDPRGRNAREGPPAPPKPRRPGSPTSQSCRWSTSIGEPSKMFTTPRKGDGSPRASPSFGFTTTSNGTRRGGSCSCPSSPRRWSRPSKGRSAIPPTATPARPARSRPRSLGCPSGWSTPSGLPARPRPPRTPR